MKKKGGGAHGGAGVWGRNPTDDPLGASREAVRPSYCAYCAKGETSFFTPVFNMDMEQLQNESSEYGCKHAFILKAILKYTDSAGLLNAPITYVELYCVHCHATKRKVIKSLD